MAEGAAGNALKKARTRVTAAVDAGIRAHGEEAYPHECCGALIGRDGRVTALLPLPNVTAEGPRRRFRVSDKDYMMSERRASELGGELLGFYHSHPDHPARPSQYDLDHAWPNFAYIIVSVSGSGEPRRPEDVVKAGLMTVWFLKDDRTSFDEGELDYGDENPDSHTAQAVHG